MPGALAMSAMRCGTPRSPGGRVEASEAEVLLEHGAGDLGGDGAELDDGGTGALGDTARVGREEQVARAGGDEGIEALGVAHIVDDEQAAAAREVLSEGLREIARGAVGTGERGPEAEGVRDVALGGRDPRGVVEVRGVEPDDAVGEVRGEAGDDVLGQGRLADAGRASDGAEVAVGRARRAGRGRIDRRGAAEVNEDLRDLALAVDPFVWRRSRGATAGAEVLSDLGMRGAHDRDQLQPEDVTQLAHDGGAHRSVGLRALDRLGRDPAQVGQLGAREAALLAATTQCVTKEQYPFGKSREHRAS